MILLDQPLADIDYLQCLEEAGNGLNKFPANVRYYLRMRWIVANCGRAFFVFTHPDPPAYPHKPGYETADEVSIFPV